MNTDHPTATPPPCHAARDGALGATETIRIKLTNHGQDDGDSGEVRQQSKPAWAGSDLNAVAKGFDESNATETNRDSKTGEPQSEDGANGHLTAPRPVTEEDDGTVAERELPGKHPNVTLRSHHDGTSKTPRQLLKSVAAELPSCSKARDSTDKQ